MNNNIARLGVIAVASIGGLTALMVILGLVGVSLYRLQIVPPKTITVVGMAKQDEVNQFASFNANVSAIGGSKEEVNTQMQELTDTLVQAAVDFGIDEKNIKTQYTSIYQEEYTDYNSPDLTVRKGSWRGNISINFQRVDGNRAQEFGDLLVSSGASSFDGPNYSLEDQNAIESQLVTSALTDAQEKATAYAESQNKSLGDVLSIDTSGTGSGIIPFFRMQGGGGGGAEAAYNPGSTEVTKSVTVVFELK